MNYGISDLASALAHSQLEQLSENLERRRSIASRYARELGDLEEIRLSAVRPQAEPAWHSYPIRLRPKCLAADRRETFRALRAEGLGVNVHYVPFHSHPYYREQLGSLLDTALSFPEGVSPAFLAALDGPGTGP